MEEVNYLGTLSDSVDKVIYEGLSKNTSMQDLAKQVTQIVTQQFSKWNWTVLCGDKFEVSTDGRRNRDVMLHKKYYDNLRVIVLRGSPLDRYTGGPACLAVVRNKLPSPQFDADNIRAAIEGANGDVGRMVENVRMYLKRHYPRDNWVVIGGDDFALSQDYEQMPSLMFCAIVGHLSIIAVKAQSPQNG